MIDSIKQYVGNLEEGVDPDFCTMVLGNDRAVGRLSDLVMNENQSLEIIRIHNLFRFYSEHKPSSLESEAYIKGQNDFLEFFMACAKEIEKKALQK